MREERDLPYRKVRGKESKRCGCREPHITISFSKRAKSSLSSASSSRVHGHVSQCDINVPVAVIKVVSSSMWQEDLTTRENEYARTGSSMYVIVDRKWVGQER